MQKNIILIQLIVIFIFPLQTWANNCDKANLLINQAYHLSHQPAEQKLLEALQLCPSNATAHNNLAVIYEKKGNYKQALYHYRQALKLYPNYFPAWVGIGDVYYKQQELALSLEAYLQACKNHPRARLRVSELLKDNRYRTAKQNEVIKHESLALLYDEKRLKKLYQLANQCREQYKSVATAQATKAFLETLVIFRNILFKTSSADLSNLSESQLDEIALTLNSKFRDKEIKIAGHSDSQGWVGKTREESKRLNQELSEKRAEAVKSGLIERGVPESQIQTRGFGDKKPRLKAYGKAAWAKNRRVEIEVVE